MCIFIGAYLWDICPLYVMCSISRRRIENISRFSHDVSCTEDILTAREAQHCSLFPPSYLHMTVLGYLDRNWNDMLEMQMMCKLLHGHKNVRLNPFPSCSTLSDDPSHYKMWSFEICWSDAGWTKSTSSVTAKNMLVWFSDLYTVLFWSFLLLQELSR